MCTAVTYRTRDHYFGRNLDLELSYGEWVTVTPRRYPLRFREEGELSRHFAMLGVAHVAGEYPLYYDAVNEKGLAMAGLNFPHSARYLPKQAGKRNIAPFELIPWVLGQCADCLQARQLLERTNLLAADFSPELPATPLHWMVADRERALVVEPMADGLHLYDAPVGVLTNEPPFPEQMGRLADFMALDARPPVNRLVPGVELEPVSRGMGAMGLPGDFSSKSRFVRAAFVRAHSLSGESEEESVSQFFHILGSVAHPRGCVRLEDGTCQITRYSSCCNLDRGVYYYTSYENSEVNGVELGREDLEQDVLVHHPMMQEMHLNIQN